MCYIPVLNINLLATHHLDRIYYWKPITGLRALNHNIIVKVKIIVASKTLLLFIHKFFKLSSV